MKRQELEVMRVENAEICVDGTASWRRLNDTIQNDDLCHKEGVYNVL